MLNLLMILKRFILPSSLIIIFVVINCQHGSSPKGKDTYIKKGKTYGVTRGLFRERWWNFYERGCSFTSGGFWDEAIADFREALKQRNEDAYRARTYGMHFVDYFPHRELGIAYYNTGQYPDAIDELSISLSQIETAKAKYFLNKARGEILKQTQSDDHPPLISNLSLKDGYITNLFKIELTGVVEDDTFVSSIAVNGSLLFIELAKKKIAFSQEVFLERGRNIIQIEARDLSGRTTTREIKVLVDREGPIIVISEPLEDETVNINKVTVKGLLRDESGIASFTLKGKGLALHGERELAFNQEVILTEGRNSLAFEAVDNAGNLTRGELSLVCDQKGSITEASSTSFQRVAFLDRVTDFGSYPLLARAETDDNISPSIRLKELTDSQTVYYDTIFIEGSAVDQSEIREIIINDIPLLIRPGRHIFFNYLAQLQEGSNHFSIQITDKFGNTATETITVIRKILQVNKIGSRLAVAILPFEQKGESSALGSLIYDGLVDAFVNRSRFNIVGRESDFEAVLRELKLSQTDLVDKTKALNLGRVVSAEGIVAGTVTETPNSIEIYARFIDTETATILAVEDVFEQDKSLPKLKFILKGLSLKIEQSFPMLEGRVVKSEGEKVYIDRGSNGSVKKEMKFIVYRKGDSILHPVTGKHLGCDTLELAEARIANVFDNFSVGKVSNNYGGVRIRVKDYFITK